MDVLPVMESYFSGEKTEGFVILCLSALALACALYFLFIQKDNFLHGIATFLFVSALAYGTVGATVYTRTDKQVTALKKQLSEKPDIFFNSEIARMEKVNKSFHLYLAIYISCLVIAALLFALSTKAYPKGLAVGMIVFSLIGLVIDYYAGERGKNYLSALRQ
jgi:hypothetical protein